MTVIKDLVVMMLFTNLLSQTVIFMMTAVTAHVNLQVKTSINSDVALVSIIDTLNSGGFTHIN